MTSIQPLMPASNVTPPVKPSPNLWVQRGLFGLLGVSSVLVSIASYRYLFGFAVLPNIAENAYFNSWLLVHVVSAATALLIGPIQFIKRARQRYLKAHRILGRVYVVSCLVGGISGIILAAGTSSGPIATAGFASLGATWLITTTWAWRSAVKGRIAEHRRWMIRSFAMTFAAVTLRLYIPIFLSTGLPFEVAYRAISWVCWVPNLMIVEVYLASTGLDSARAASDPTASEQLQAKPVTTTNDATSAP